MMHYGTSPHVSQVVDTMCAPNNWAQSGLEIGGNSTRFQSLPADQASGGESLQRAGYAVRSEPSEPHRFITFSAGPAQATDWRNRALGTLLQGKGL